MQLRFPTLVHSRMPQTCPITLNWRFVATPFRDDADGRDLEATTMGDGGMGAPGRKSKFLRTASRISLSGMVPVP